MGTNEKTKTNVSVDAALNLQIMTDQKMKRLKNESEMTKEEAMGKMIEERHELQIVLDKKEMSFDELINFLSRK
jgi:hypothetical protein